MVGAFEVVDLQCHGGPAPQTHVVPDCLALGACVAMAESPQGSRSPSVFAPRHDSAGFTAPCCASITEPMNEPFAFTVVRARLSPETPTPKTGGRLGYGRDVDEARAHAGFPDRPLEGELFDEVLVSDVGGNAAAGDEAVALSHDIAHEVCGFHLSDADEDTPEAVKAAIRAHLQAGHYASAVATLFEQVWDGGWEDDAAANGGDVP